MYCDDCQFPLSACGEQGVDGVPTMDCQVCKLRSLLAAERAAREQAEARLATVARVLDNRLNEKRHLMGCGAETLACIEQVQEYISTTIPPPILTEQSNLELAALKLKLEGLSNAARLILHSDTPPSGPLLTNLANALNQSHD